MRGRAGVGNFTLSKSKLEFRIEIEDIPNIQIIPYEDIMTSIKNGEYNLQSIAETDTVSSNVMVTKANELL